MTGRVLDLGRGEEEHLRAQTQCHPHGQSHYRSAGAGGRWDCDSHQERHGIARRNIYRDRISTFMSSEEFKEADPKGSGRQKASKQKKLRGESVSDSSKDLILSSFAGGGRQGETTVSVNLPFHLSKHAPEDPKIKHNA